MAKIRIKSENLIPFGGIFPIMEYFDSKLSPVIDRVLGLRCKQFVYQYSEIIRSLMCVYLCGGSCVEDLSSHLLRHLSLHPTLRTCSSDTVLRIMGELKETNVTYTSETGRSYDFNTADGLNDLLVNSEAVPPGRALCRHSCQNAVRNADRVCPYYCHDLPVLLFHLQILHIIRKAQRS